MKKFLCLVTALLMLLSCTAFAEAVPSKTLDDEVKASVAGDLFSFIVLPEDQDPDWATAEVARVADVIANGGTVADALKVDVDLAGMECYELDCVCTDGYKEEMGDVDVTIDYVTDYQAGQTVYAVVGFQAGDEVAYVSQMGEVLEDGSVLFHFTGDVLAKLEQEAGLMFVVSTPIAE